MLEGDIRNGREEQQKREKLRVTARGIELACVEKIVGAMNEFAAVTARANQKSIGSGACWSCCDLETLVPDNLQRVLVFLETGKRRMPQVAVGAPFYKLGQLFRSGCRTVICGI